MRSRATAIRSLALLLALAACLAPLGTATPFGTAAARATEAVAPQFARLQTEAGDILLVLHPGLAPNHVANFRHLVSTGFYDGTRFHRIVPGFVIQGGDPNSKDDERHNDGTGGPLVRDVLTATETAAVAAASRALEARGYVGLTGRARLKAEFSPAAKHVRGTLSMAREPGDNDSAGSQFFICVSDTPNLDGQYTIFGHVVAGLDVVDRIVSGEKDPTAGRDAPAVPVQVIKAVLIEGAAGLTEAEREAWAALPEGLRNRN